MIDFILCFYWVHLLTYVLSFNFIILSIFYAMRLNLSQKKEAL